MFTKVAIINRGEPALRFIRALEEFNHQNDCAIQSVAFYTDGDEESPFVRQADLAIDIGSPLRMQENGSSINAYCDHLYLLHLLQEYQCDAVWPGWGFISEDAQFVEKLEKAGIIFLGPSSKAMAQLGDKIAAKYLAEQCDVPLAPWAEWSEDWDAQKQESEAIRIGFPLMVKAAAGGGGRGIRKVQRLEELSETLQTVQQEVQKFFGQGGILLEKCIAMARHIEVQLVCTPQKAYAVGIRDCSIQRKNQKVIEEAPSPILPKAIQEKLFQSSEKLAETCGYVGVATAEFLYQPQSNTCSFLEVNSRLQVEHTITEAITGLDLVQAQIAIALGWDWEPGDILTHGHAIELRVNAEDPEQNFRPAPGQLVLFRPPSGPGIRVDSGVTEGMKISEYFDSMIAKLIVWAPTREQCIARARRACLELDAAVEDGSTNQAFLLDVLKHDAFVTGQADTMWLDRAMQDGDVVRVGAQKEALLAAAILEYKRYTQEKIAKFFIQNQDGIPFQFPENQGESIELRLRGYQYCFQVAALDGQDFLIEIQEDIFQVHLRTITSHIAEMWLDNQRHKILYSYGSSGITVELDGYSHTIERSSGGLVKSPTPAVVVNIAVHIGDTVQIGDRLCTLEAMKMELGVFATEPGIVRDILCQANQQVSLGDTLLIMDLQSGTQSQKKRDFEKASPFSLLHLPKENPLLTIDQMPIAEQKVIIQQMRSIIRAILLGFDVLAQTQQILNTLLSQTDCLQQSKNPQIWEPLLDCLAMFSSTCQILDRDVLWDLDEATSIPANMAFYEFCRTHHQAEKAVPSFLEKPLKMALQWYNIHDFKSTSWMEESLFRIAVANHHNGQRHHLLSQILRLFLALHNTNWITPPAFSHLLEQTGQAALSTYPFVQDNAIQAHYLYFDRRKYTRGQQEIKSAVQSFFNNMTSFGAHSKVVRTAMRKLGRSPQEVQYPIFEMHHHSTASKHRILEALTRRMYIGQQYIWQQDHTLSQDCFAIQGNCTDNHSTILSIWIAKKLCSEPQQWAPLFKEHCNDITNMEIILEEAPSSSILTDDWIGTHLLNSDFFKYLSNTPLRLTISWFENRHQKHLSFEKNAGQYFAQNLLQDIHPEAAKRINLNSLGNFHLHRHPSQEHLYAFVGQAKNNPKDERIFILAEVFGKFHEENAFPLWEFERVFFEAVRAIREIQSSRTTHNRLQWNWLFFHIHPVLDISEKLLRQFAKQLEPYTRGLNLRQVHLRLRTKENRFQWRTLQLRRSGNHRLEFQWMSEPNLLEAMTAYDMKVVRAQKFGHVYPYEMIRMLEGAKSDITRPHPDMKEGRFQEFDLDENHQAIPVFRPLGQNTCGVVFGMISNCTRKFPKGLQRVWIASDSTKAMGSLAQKECQRIIAALDLAEKYQLPVEWIPVSAGAMISMNSGTENLDWTAQVLARIIAFTQNGGSINLIVHGINVGAQSYWNAEANMLMHTKGCLIMTHQASMVLTGKKALDFSGGISAEDERGIGGVERIMGPNGQAQFIAQDLGEAYHILFEYYRHTYHDPQEGRTRLFKSHDPKDRDVSVYPYLDNRHANFENIGDIFSKTHNPDRKKPFAIRQIMFALIDQDSDPLERFAQLHQGESAVVWLSHIGGHPVTLIGMESAPIPRRGRIPIDGPDTWTGGTLFPQSSKKIARSINAASGVHPIVILANLSGFDGSPESLRQLQLEYGAEIGRAVVNCQSPIIFVVVGRYHGGAYVVFSKALNSKLTALAIEGSFASVIGGAPAAAVVFPRKVQELVNLDPRMIEKQAKISQASDLEKPKMIEELKKLQNAILLEKRGVVAQEFDQIHSVKRAVEVGSLDEIINISQMRPKIIATLDKHR